jgi:hypothetical protein
MKHKKRALPRVGAEKHTLQTRALSFRFKLAVVPGSILVALLFVEVVLRVMYGSGSARQADERLAYQHDPELGWFPIPNSSKRITGSRTITAVHNSKGFREAEHPKDHKPVMLFLGDSFVWGYDVEASERFTEKLQAKHPEWEIHNFGVSGYGTDQEYLLLRRYFEEYKPHAVVLVVCGDNDNEDNAWNCRGGYYKPYFTLENGRLSLHGVPVPKSEKTFFAEHQLLSSPYVMRVLVQSWYHMTLPAVIRNPDPPTGVLFLEMRNYVTNHGASFAIGMQQYNSELEQFLQKFEILHADLTTTNESHRYPAFGKHWTPEGHTLVAERLDHFLKK